MAQDLTYVGLGNLTVKRGPNDELFVTGKATGDDLDLDQQICDATWLKSAMPLWFETGANVREQHSSIAAGVGISLDNTGADWYLKSEVVDPITARKVERGVLRGYSIGIKGARVIKDAAAPGGRIVGGQIVEISLVDRPANPTARIEIAKAVDGGSLELIKSDVMETERKPSARDNEELYPAVAVCPGCNGLGTVTDNPGVLDDTCKICNGSGEKPRDWNADEGGLSVTDDDANHDIKTIVVDEPEDAPIDVIADGDKPNDVEALPIEESKADYSDKQREAMQSSGEAMEGGGYPIKTVADLKNAIQAIGRAKDRAATVAHIIARAKKLGREDLIPDSFKEVKHDEATLQSVRAGLIALMKAELDEMLSGEDDEVCDVKELLCSLELFLCWWNGESEESETSKPFTMESEYESEDNMAFVGLGVSADLIKAATAVEASDTDKELLRDEVLKALGVADTIAETKATLEVQEETLKSLNAELAAIRELATPGGPAIRQTQTQALKSADAERLQNDAARMRTLAAEMIDPIYKARYLEKAEQLEADSKRVLRG
jgi:hypothetical protein